MAEKNWYQGVNAHLMSYHQNYTGYKGFHNNFVTYLSGHLNEMMGGRYRAATEDTLKILQTLGAGDPFSKITYPDISVREQSRQSPFATVGVGVVPDLYLPAPKVAEGTEPLAVAIYEKDLMKPVAVIEMLSPSNKISGEGRKEYIEKRYLITQSKIVLVEVDLLHESRSVIDDLPHYPHEPNSTPYYLAVTDLSRHDKTAIYRFGVNQPIPKIPIVLLHDDVVVCDFDKVYQETFEKGLFGAILQENNEPVRMSAYSSTDQQKIRAVMASAE